MDKFTSGDKIEVILKNEEQPADYEEISLREIIQALINGRKIIAIMLVAAILLSTAGVFFTTSSIGKAQIMISLNFNGIEKGLDPYGQKFDIGMIKSPLVTSRVVEALSLEKNKITADAIRKNISIQPVVPGGIVNKLKTLKESVEKGRENVKVLEEFVYYPNEYIISFSLEKDLKISKAKGREILNELIDSYSQYFFETYGDKAVLANAIGTLDYEQYDYPEVTIIMRNQIDIMQSYLSRKVKEAKDFRSNKTGLTFNDIMETVSVVSSVDINRLDAIVGSYKLTKNRDNLIKSFEYAIKRLELNKAKKEDESRANRDAINKFEKDKNIVLLPGSSDSRLGTLETSAPNPLYDELVNKSLSAGVSATNSIHDIEYYKKEIENFKSADGFSPQQKTEAEKEVIAMIDRVKEKLDRLITLSNDTATDYYETQYSNKAILRLSPVEVSGVKSNLMRTVGVAAALGLFLGVAIALFMEYWKNSGDIKNKVSKILSNNKASV